MFGRLVCLLGLAALPLPFAALAAGASADGSVPARTGGFGEATCRECHWDNPLNEPSGELRLDGVPRSYTPGDRYVLTVTLTRPRLERAGFQIAAREAGINMSSGTDAGTLRPAGDRVHSVHGEAGRVTYLQQTREGARAASNGRATWTLEWAAPAESRPVIFHVTGNASNADDSPLGDFIYAVEVRSSPAE